MSGCTKTVTITSYSLDNGTWCKVRETTVKQSHINANIRFIDAGGPVEIEPLIKNENGFSYFDLTKSLWDAGIETAKDTIHWNIGETDKTEINIHDN
jgi:hypothetical protein